VASVGAVSLDVPAAAGAPAPILVVSWLVVERCEAFDDDDDDEDEEDGK